MYMYDVYLYNHYVPHCAQEMLYKHVQSLLWIRADKEEVTCSRRRAVSHTAETLEPGPRAVPSYSARP